MSDKRNQFDTIMGKRQSDQSGYNGQMDEATLAGLAALKGKSAKGIALELSSKDIRTGAFRWTATGLKIDGEITREDWEQTGRMLKFLDTAMQWLIGDWLVTGEKVGYGDYEAFAQKIGFEIQTLYNYRWVASKIEISLRKENLYFGHHNLVAGMKSNEQAYWLDRAVNEGLSVAKLREAIKGQPEQIETRLDKFISKVSSIAKDAKKLAGVERQEAIKLLKELLAALEESNG